MEETEAEGPYCRGEKQEDTDMEKERRERGESPPHWQIPLITFHH
jgi:hypothetical protein